MVTSCWERGRGMVILMVFLGPSPTNGSYIYFINLTDSWHDYSPKGTGSTGPENFVQGHNLRPRIIPKASSLERRQTLSAITICPDFLSCKSDWRFCNIPRLRYGRSETSLEVVLFSVEVSIVWRSCSTYSTSWMWEEGVWISCDTEHPSYIDIASLCHMILIKEQSACG